MRDENVWSDSLGQNPYSKASWISSARWESIESNYFVHTEPGDESLGRVEALVLSLPPAAHDAIVQSSHVPRGAATFLPWGDSGVGLVTLAVSARAAGSLASTFQGVVTILDIAGRSDLGLLRSADARGRACVFAMSDSDPEIRTWLPVLGLSEALNEASKHRRLAAREFVSAIEGMRWLMRSPAVYPMLGVPADREVDALTLCVCRPL